LSHIKTLYTFIRNESHAWICNLIGKGSIYGKSGNYVLEKYTLNKPVKVLNSTVNLEGEVQGAKQVFSTEVEGASTVEQGSLDGSDFKSTDGPK
jgi:hypothetical protein